MKKPTPPPDLWELLDKEVNSSFAPPPRDSFTIKAFCERYNLTNQMARTQIRKLIDKGSVIEIGRYGQRNERYFALAEAK